jgi:hypothetical protein
VRALAIVAMTAALLPAQESRAFRVNERDEVRTFEDGIRPARTLHVERTGDDAAGDGSASRPFRTLGRAAKSAVAGTAIELGGGIHEAGTFLEGVHGRPGAPIWIGGPPIGDLAVIEGRGEGLHLSRASWVVVHDLEVRNVPGNGVNADDGGDTSNPEASRFLVFKRLRFHDIGKGGNQDGLKLSGVSDFAVVDCQFSRCGGGGAGSGIDQVGCHRGIVSKSQFSWMSGNAIQVKGGSEDVEILNCAMTGAGERALNLGGSTGADYFRPPLRPGTPGFEARNIRVRGCSIFGSRATVAFVGCVDCSVTDCVISRPEVWVLRILQETRSAGGVDFLPGSGGRFERNQVHYDRRGIRSVVNVGPGTDAASFRFADNAWHAEGEPDAPPPELPTPESRTAGR